MKRKYHRYGKRRARHTSMAMVSQTGMAAPSWTPAPELAALANECFRACINPEAKPDLIRVYRNSGTSTNGRCWVDQRLIVVNRSLCDPTHTLAHEVAHLRFKAHGPRHKELTEQLFTWMTEHGNDKD